LASFVSVDLLKSHPKNAEYFSPATPEKREEIRRSILAQGIRDPLKVAPD
jgi:ParB family chromosome partitioning protein